MLIDNKKSEWKPWKVIAKEYIFGKVADTQPAPHYWYFPSNLSASKEFVLQYENYSISLLMSK